MNTIHTSLSALSNTRTSSRTPQLGGRAFKAVATASAVAFVIFTVGCANQELSPRQKGTATGAVIGAVSGAVIASGTGGKAGQGAVIGGVVGAVAGNLWSKHMEEKRRALEQATSGTGIDVQRTADNRIKLNVPSDFSFDTAKSDIKPAMKPVLDEIARNLAGDVQLEVIGHTDSVGSESYNRPLSIERADAVRQYLATRGVSATRVAINGMGESQPVATNDTEAGRAINRRVEIFLAQKATPVDKNS